MAGKLTSAAGVSLVKIERPEQGRFPLSCRQDSRLVFENHAPYLARKALEIIEGRLESPDEEKQELGMEFLAKFGKNIFRAQPTEHINVNAKMGIVNETLLAEMEKRLGRSLTNGKRQVVEAEAVVIGTSPATTESDIPSTGGTDPKRVSGRGITGKLVSQKENISD